MRSYRTRFTENTIVTKDIGESVTVWLGGINKYIIVSPLVGEIIRNIHNGISTSSTAKSLTELHGLNKDEVLLLIEEVQGNLDKLYNGLSEESGKDISSEFALPGSFILRRFYLIFGKVFLFEFENKEIENMFHPKFNHLETGNSLEYDTHFRVFISGGKKVLTVDGKHIGNWETGMESFLAGKVSMEILQKIYENSEDAWLAVFHASAVVKDNTCIMFSGDSGAGKSTVAALLSAQGFTVLSDDFLPLLAETKHLCSFPAAISIKKDSYNGINNYFQDLNEMSEYEYPYAKKTVKYLSNSQLKNQAPLSCECNTLIFVRYEAGLELEFTRVEPDFALQKLVPDSWIFDSSVHAEMFLDWFSGLSCYSLVYGSNEKMISTIQKYIAHEIC